MGLGFGLGGGAARLEILPLMASPEEDAPVSLGWDEDNSLALCVIVCEAVNSARSGSVRPS